MIRKLFIIFFSFVCLFLNISKAEAKIYSIVPIGSPVVTETTITQNYIMRLFQRGDWELKVQAQEPYWVNAEDPSYKIPATNTEFITQDGTFRLPLNDDVEIYEYEGYPVVNLPFSVRVDKIQGVRGGSYTLPLAFSIDGEVSYFTMNINIPIELDITTTVPTAYINFTEAEVFDLNAEVSNVVDTQINIKSDRKWNLYLDTSNFGNAIGNYKYEVVIGEGANIIIPNRSKSPLVAGQNYLLAIGDASYTKTQPAMEIPTYIRIRYYLNNNTLDYFDEGSFTNNLIYRIEEK